MFISAGHLCYEQNRCAERTLVQIMPGILKKHCGIFLQGGGGRREILQDFERCIFLGHLYVSTQEEIPIYLIMYISRNLYIFNHLQMNINLTIITLFFRLLPDNMLFVFTVLLGIYLAARKFRQVNSTSDYSIYHILFVFLSLS